MTKEELKALGLTDEQADKVVKDYQDNYVAKTEYDTQATALKQAQNEQKKVAKALDDLKKSHEKDGDLAAQIEQMKTDAAERQKHNVSILDYGVFISSVLALVVIGAYVWRKCHA